jgi:hypothetical protein
MEDIARCASSAHRLDISDGHHVSGGIFLLMDGKTHGFPSSMCSSSACRSVQRPFISPSGCIYLQVTDLPAGGTTEDIHVRFNDASYEGLRDYIQCLRRSIDGMSPPDFTLPARSSWGTIDEIVTDLRFLMTCCAGLRGAVEQAACSFGGKSENGPANMVVLLDFNVDGYQMGECCLTVNTVE